MKKKGLLSIIFFSCFTVLYSQITLQKVNSKSTVTIPLESNIRLKFPTVTSTDSCNCYQSYYGTLKGNDKNKVKVFVTYDEKMFTDGNGISKKTKTYYEYTKQKIENTFVTDKLMALSKSNKVNNTLQRIGATFAILSVIHSLAISPLLDIDTRRKSDKITLGVFLVGISTVFIRSEKTYHFQQPKNKKKKALWLIKTQ